MVQKQASGVTVYIQEELGNARLCLAQLTRYIVDGIQLIDRSSHRDHFYEVAGHLIEKAPEALARLQSSLSAVALAADRMDYEELKQDLHPHKVVELERVLEENRLRHVRRQGMPTMLTTIDVAKTLRDLAARTRSDGAVPIRDLVALVADLEQGRKTARTVESAADSLEASAEALEQAARGQASRVQLASSLREMVGDYITASQGVTAAGEGIDLRAISRAIGDIEIDVEAMMGQGAPAMVEEGLEAIQLHTKRLKKHLGLRMAASTKKFVVEDVENMVYASTHKDYMRGDRVEVVRGKSKGLEGEVTYVGSGPKGDQVSVALDNPVQRMMGPAIFDPRDLRKVRTAASEEKEGKFEEGKPADPTENMSPEDAKKWEENVDHDGSNIKKAGIENRLRNVLRALPTVARETVMSTEQPLNFYANVGSLLAILELALKRITKDPREARLLRVVIDRLGEVGEAYRHGNSWASDAGDPERDVVYASDDSDKLLRAMEKVVQTIEDRLKDMQHAVAKFKADPGKNAPQADNFAQDVNSIAAVLRIFDRAKGRTAATEEKESKFEKGKPADPTENMSPEDAKKWEENVDHDGSNIKKGSESAPLKKAILNAMEFAEKEGHALVDRVRSEDMTNLDAELEGALETMRATTHALKRTADIVMHYGEGKGHLQHLEKLVKDFADEAIEAFGWLAYVRGIASKATPEEMGGLTVRLAAIEAKQSKFEKGKPADPTENMNPEDAKKWQEMNDEHGDKFKKASADSIRIKGRGSKLLLEEGFEDPQSVDRRGAVLAVSKRLVGAPKTIVMTDAYSLGPHRAATGSSYQYAILDKRGTPVVEGNDSVKMWTLYGGAMIDGKSIRPVKMATESWGGADPWSGTVKTAVDKKLQTEVSRLLNQSRAETTLDNGNDWKGELDGFKLWVGSPSGSRSSQFDYDVLDPKRSKAVSGKVRSFSTLSKKLAEAIENLKGETRDKMATQSKSAKDYGVGDDNGWGGADPWPGTGKEAAWKVGGSKRKPERDKRELEALRDVLREYGGHVDDAENFQDQGVSPKELEKRMKSQAQDELEALEDLLKRNGYDPKDAKKLLDEGMGEEELKDRLKNKPGSVGSLEHSHGIKKKAASTDLSSEELVAMHHLVHYKPGYRAEYFKENNLGEYGPGNNVIQSLVRKGFVKIQGGKSVVPDARKIRAILKENFAPKGFFIENSSLMFKKTASLALEGVDWKA